MDSNNMNHKNEVLGKLLEHGLRVTPQRVKIVELLENRKDHPTAEKIYSELKKLFPSISFATVYNTLEVLCELGLLQELNIECERKHFDPDTTMHYHFLCKKCNKIEDVFADIDFDKITGKLDKAVKIDSYRIQLYGICKACNTVKKGGSGK